MQTTLGSLAAQGALTFSDGYRTKKSELAAEGFRILRAGDIRDGIPIFDSPDHVQMRMSSVIGAKTVREGDVVLTTKGTVGKTALVSAKPPSPAVYSPQLCYFRPDAQVLLPRYLYFWFSSPEFVHQLSSLKSSTDMAPYISLTQLGGVTIRLPPLPTQQAIAGVLGALDDKIRVNARAVRRIQHLGRNHFTLNASARAQLTDLARFVNGRNFTKGASRIGRVVIRIAELNSGVGKSTVYTATEVPEDHLANPGEVLFSWSGSLTLKRWMLPAGIVNQHIFKVIPNEATPAWLAFHALRTQMPAFKAIAADKATTMGHIQRKHLEVDVPVPSPEAQHKMATLMQSLWDLELATEQESQKLVQLRDTLLPALMDGTLRIRDAITQAESAL